MDKKEIETAIESVDVERRAALREMLTRTAFVAPVVATFAMTGLSVHEAHAYSSNTTILK
jgi:hypothetical protein